MEDIKEKVETNVGKVSDHVSNQHEKPVANIDDLSQVCLQLIQELEKHELNDKVSSDVDMVKLALQGYDSNRIIGSMLLTAKKEARSINEQAEKKSSRMISAAKKKSAEIIHEAEEKSEFIIKQGMMDSKEKIQINNDAIEDLKDKIDKSFTQILKEVEDF